MVIGNRTANLSATIEIRQHKVVTGLSTQNGGLDEGPNPHELIEAALTSCTILTCEMYAQRKKMNLVNTFVSTKIISETKEGAVIQRTLKFEGDLTQEDRDKLVEIADKCPIHRLLQGKIEIQTTLTV